MTRYGYFTLAALLPTLLLAMRRPRDIDRFGWWILVVAVGVGVAALMY